MTRMSAVDAQTFWMSSKVPNDQFLLYAFGGAPGGLDDVMGGLHSRAAACAELRLRIADDCALRYPRWVCGDVDTTQFIVYDWAGLGWAACLDAVAALADRQLDPARAAWRLHVFTGVHDAPCAAMPLTVAVLQMAHALADGTRAADLAAWLFGRNRPVTPIAPEPRGSLVVCSLAAARAHRDLVADTAAGAVPAARGPRPPLVTNVGPRGAGWIRVLLRPRERLTTGSTVTVAVLTAIGTALAGHLRDRGEDPARLAAEVPMANGGIRYAHNHFHNVGVDLYPDAGPADRAALIARQLRDARTRADHPAMHAERRSLAAIPAPLLRWGVEQFDPAVRVPAVTGNTVVSSVNRGLADLWFGAAPVVLTAGFPALSPMMGLTHGVHGIGETVAVSVHAAQSVFDTDGLADYTTRLEAALA
jgi:hypothetical protein